MELKPVELNLDTDKLATEWAMYTVRHLRVALLEGQKAPSRDLIRSIENELLKNGGNIEKVVLRFNQYGRFLDMGVGRGVSVGVAGTGAFSAARNSDGTLKRYRRKALKWYSKTYYHEVQRFTELYANIFGKDIPLQVSSALTTEISSHI